MVIFEDIQDVKEWLEPLDWVDFWDAVAPYNLVLQEREFCEDQIRSGDVEQALVLDCLKSIARIELTEKLNLKNRIPEPVVAQYIQSVH
jgi:hypothetical protein